MDNEYEYACTNGTFIIGQVGSREHAEDVRRRNFEAAQRAGDSSRHLYRVVRRETSRLLTARPGHWLPVED